jgi:hypothetical protein
MKYAQQDAEPQNKNHEIGPQRCIILLQGKRYLSESEGWGIRCYSQKQLFLSIIYIYI